MAVNTDTTMVVPMSSFALSPVPATRFGVVVVEGGALLPARVEKMVVVEHPVGTGVVQARVLVVLAGGFEHSAFSVVYSTFTFTFELVFCYIGLRIRGFYIISVG